jgi:hypothetical protein
MKRELLFIQPFRLGDILIQSAMVHHFSMIYDKVYFPFDKSCIPMKWNLNFNDNVIIDEVDYPICECSDRLIKDLNIDTSKVDVINMLVGFGQPNDELTTSFNRSRKRFDVYKYEKVGLTISDKWSKFRYRRDNKKEQELYEKLNIKKPYIFLHDGGSHGLYHIKKHLVPQNVNTLRPVEGITDNIFDYLKIIEEAEQVHCIDSSFSNLIDLIGIGKKNYFHRYARNISPVTINKGLWNEIR